VTEVDSDKGRFSLSLKPSAVGAGDGEYLDSLFRCAQGCVLWGGVGWGVF